jgi:hypothetical protein
VAIRSAREQSMRTVAEPDRLSLPVPCTPATFERIGAEIVHLVGDIGHEGVELVEARHAVLF